MLQKTEGHLSIGFRVHLEDDNSGDGDLAGGRRNAPRAPSLQGVHAHLSQESEDVGCQGHGCLENDQHHAAE